MNMPKATTASLLFTFLVVVAAQAGDFTPPAGVRVLTEDEIKETFIGNSAKGAGGLSGTWREYYTPDGKISGVTSDGRPYRNPNSWNIKESTMCFDYAINEYDTCSIIGVDADGLIYYYDPDTGELKAQGQVLSGKQL